MSKIFYIRLIKTVDIPFLAKKNNKKPVARVVTVVGNTKPAGNVRKQYVPRKQP